MRVHALLFFGVASIPLIAGTVSIQTNSTLPFTPPGSTSCAQSSTGPVSCAINATFSDPTGRHETHADGSATADFGSISGRIYSFMDDANSFFEPAIGSSYASSFDDFVTVFGGNGAGELITHYQLVSLNGQTHADGQAVRPSYFFSQGDVGLGYTPDLPPAPSSVTATLTENLDVISSIMFGEPIRIAASTSATHSIFFSSSTIVDLTTSSSARITGYTVLDASGAIVANAMIQRGNVPEPGTVWSGIVGALISTIGYWHRQRQ